MQEKRYSDRVNVAIPIEVVGVELTGETFAEISRTVKLNRAGAAFLVKRKLAPHQEISIRNLANGREATFRVVGQIGQGDEGFVYAAALADESGNIWDIDFPPLSSADEAVGRTLLECSACHSREVVYLDELHAEVFHVNRHISRACQRCAQDTLWKEAEHDISPQPAPRKTTRLQPAAPPPPPRPPTRNTRKHVRVSIRFNACIRRRRSIEEIVVTENVSRGGLCFKTDKVYELGENVEVAMPYSKTAANIFSPAVIVNARPLASEGKTLYGVKFNKETP
jgi:hypothetical protein